MAEKIVMPQLGESVTEGTISKWLVKKGDFVKKYDPLCEVSTDKVNAEVPAAFSGMIGELVVEEGQTVGVGTLICYIETQEQRPSTQIVESLKSEGAYTQEELPPSISSDNKHRYSPAVLKLSGEYGVDLSLIQGTGAGGRVTRKDVLAFAKEVQVGHTIQAAQVPPIQQPAREISIPEAHVEQQNWSPSYNQSIQARSDDQMIPASTVRKTIASRMVQSKQEIPHAWTMIECDVTNLVNYREKIKDDFKQKEGINLTYLPFFIKAVVEAIKEFPIINSQWSDGQIIMKKRIHISLAVATEEALYVPVIKDADQRSILGLAKVMDDLVTRTREGKLTVEDMAGGTFTVNNTGSFGSIQSAPIINYPQAAILSVEAIVKRPVVIHNMIAIRDMVNLCLSLDHRVLDGLVCGRFLQSIKNRIESYGLDTNMY